MSTDMNHDQDDASRMPVATPKDGAEDSKTPDLPDDMLIILPVRNLVLFPGVILPVAIKREKTVAGAQEAVRVEGKVGFLLQKNPETEDPTFDELHRIGTAATIVRYITAPDGIGAPNTWLGIMNAIIQLAVAATATGCRCPPPAALH